MAKEASERTVTIVFMVFLIVTIISNFIIFYSSQDLGLSRNKLEGRAMSANVEMCVNRAPELSVTNCPDTALTGAEYSCYAVVNETDSEQNITFASDSALFKTYPNGSVLFMPVLSDAGIYYVNITAWDDSGCSNGFASAILEVLIAPSFCSDSCSSSSCVSCPSVVVSLAPDYPFNNDSIVQVNLTSSTSFDSVPTLNAISTGSYYVQPVLWTSTDTWVGTLEINSSFEEGISNFSLYAYTASTVVRSISSGSRFIVDRSVPTTYDDSSVGFHAVPYNISIYPNDTFSEVNRTYFCTDTTDLCNPSDESNFSAAIPIGFSETNRGMNYLRYYSIDNASNQQNIASSQIVMNYLPVSEFGGTNGTVKGGSSILMETISSDPDSHTLSLYVCNTTTTCKDNSGNQLCVNSSAANVSCSFASELTDADYTAYNFVYDEVNETSNNSPFNISFTTDSTAPSVTNMSMQIALYNFTLSFEMDEESTVSLEYGETHDFGNSSVNQSLNTNISVVVAELQPNTIYYFQILSEDIYGNNRTSRLYSLKTPELIIVSAAANETISIDRTNQSDFGMKIDAMPISTLENVSIVLTVSDVPLVNTTMEVPGIMYISIDVDSLLSSSVDFVYYQFSYNESRINASNIDEQSMRINYYNETTSSWNRYDWPDGNVSVDEDFVWANVSHFSLYSVGGVYNNGQSCTSDSQCGSGNCAADYDGSPVSPNGWCQAAGSCSHDSSATTSSVCSGDTLISCSSGDWVSQACQYGCVSGTNAVCSSAPVSSSSSTASAGGSDGGSMASAPKSVNYFEKQWSLLKPGPLEVVISNDLIAFTKLQFNLFEEVRNARLKVKSLSENELSPQLIPVYRYTSLEAADIIAHNEPDKTIYFKIPNAWISSRSMSPEHIILYSKQDSEWIPIKTYSAQQDSAYSYFSSVIAPPADSILYYGIGLHRIEPETDVIKVMLKQGASFRKTFYVGNLGSWKSKVQTSIKGGIEGADTSATSAANLVSIDSDDLEFVLERGVKQEIGLSFSADSSLAPGVYVKKLVIESGISRKEVQVIVEVESSTVFFDVSLDIPANYKEVGVGGEIAYQIILVNLREIGMESVTLTYSIIDSDGREIFKTSEEAAVEKEVSFVRKIILSSELPPGNYILAVRAQYKESLGAASEKFIIKEYAASPSQIPVQLVAAGPQTNTGYYLIIVGISLTVIVVIIYSFQTFRRVEGKLSRIALERSQLSRKLELLEQGHAKGYITEESYKHGREEIRKELERIERV